MFHPATQRWFDEHFRAPTEIQRLGWARIREGEHALLVAPTGSGKTLAAFLAGIDALGGLPDDAPPGVRVLYVSPLKALVYDIERNLRAPLVGIVRAAERLEQVRTEVRSALRDRLRDILARAEDSVRYTMNRLVGEAYRQSLIQIVRENGGRVIRDQATGSVLNLELEIG